MALFNWIIKSPKTSFGDGFIRGGEQIKPRAYNWAFDPKLEFFGLFGINTKESTQSYFVHHVVPLSFVGGPP